MLLLLACAAPVDDEEGLPASAEPVEDSATPAGDSGVDAPQPGTWGDPILAGATLDLDVARPELTDAMIAGDQLVFVGQEQGRDGGMWSFSLADPDAPVLLGHTTDRTHIQRACWDGSQAWGMTREGQLLTLSLGATGPVVLREGAVGTVGTGLDCSADVVAWGEGASGGGWAAREGTWIGAERALTGDVQDVLIEGSRMWLLARDRLTAYDIQGEALTELGHVELDGTCLDLSPGADWLAVACGSGGVALVDRADGQPSRLGAWTGPAAARAVSVQGDSVWVAGWTDLLLLDASDPAGPRLVGVEAAPASAMSVVAGAGERAYVADWNRPFVVTRTGASAPEVRLSTGWVSAGGAATVHNDGTEALWLDGLSLAPGASWTWEIPDDATGLLSLPTDDPDEATISVEVGGPGGLLVGQDAPNFSEPDLRGELWELAKLHGEVVFLGLFTDG